MGGSEENISRTEKFKITGIIAVAIFVVSMMLWSSFEVHIQRLVAGIFDNIQSFLSRISNTIAIAYFEVLYPLPITI
jgi:hypothetical protein